MRELLSFCFEQLTDPLSLPLDPIVEYFVLAFIEVFVFKLARKLVGDMYDAGSISGSALGSIFHWGIRIGLFVFIWWLVNAAITAYHFITEHWIILIATISLLVVAFFLIRYFIMHNRLKTPNRTERRP